MAENKDTNPDEPNGSTATRQDESLLQEDNADDLLTPDDIECSDGLSGKLIRSQVGDEHPKRTNKEDGEKRAKLNFITGVRRKCREDPAYASALKHSLCLALSLFALGLVESQSGPTFLDLQIITGTTVGQASAFFTSHWFGYLLGSALTGYIIGRKINRSLFLLLSILSMGGAAIVLPYCSPYGAMIFIRGLQGLCGGAVDTAATAEHMRIWNNKGHVLMQLLQFCLALGGVVSPLVTEPFLAEQQKESPAHTCTGSGNGTGLCNVQGKINHRTGLFSNASLNLSTPILGQANHSLIPYSSHSVDDIILLPNSSTSQLNSDKNTTLSTTQVPTTTNVHWAFLITGTVVILTSIPFFFLCQKARRQNKAAKRRKEIGDPTGNDSTSENDVKYRQLPRSVYGTLLAGVCVFYFLYCGVEDTFVSFLMTFVVRRFDSVSKSDGAFITTVYWASFSISRFLMIYISRFLSPVRLLYMGGTLLLISLTGFTISSGAWVPGSEAQGEGSVPTLIFFTALTGLGTSGIFPASISWVGAELLPVDGTVSACMIGTSSAGAMVNPLLVSWLMEELSNLWFCYLLLLQLLAVITFFCCLLAYNRCVVNTRYGPMHTAEKKVEEMDMIGNTDV